MTKLQIFLLLGIVFILVPSIDLVKNDNDNDTSSLRFEQQKTRLLKGNQSRHPPKSWRQREVKMFQMSEELSYFGKLQSNSQNTKAAMVSTKYLQLDPLMKKKDGVIDHQSLTETSDALIKSLCNMNGKTKVCYTHGQSVCRCKGELADCSGKPFVPNVAYAPRLPPEIKCLIFHYNNAAHLDDSYFANVSDFRVIDFSHNKLQTVSRKTFARFNQNLIYLLLNSNILPFSGIRNVFSFPPSQRLDLIDAGISQPIPKNFFQPFANISLSELYLDLNYLKVLDLREFSVLKNLKTLSVKNGSISQVISDTMLSLKVLNLENNPIPTFPDTCRKMHSLPGQIKRQFDPSMFPKLKTLLIGNANIKAFPHHTELCLPKLELLFMFLNNISTFHNHSLQSLTSLTVLILDRMKSNITHIENSAFSSKTLLSLHLTKNHIRFASKNISDLMFQDCPSLKVLHLDHNNFLNVSENSYANLFANLSQLTSLYMGSCQATFIPTNALAHLVNVNRLFLYLNKITSIPPAAFDAMSSLEFLYLDENQIATVNPQSFSKETIQRLKEVDLNRNNFQCNCDLLWFQSWLMQDGPAKFYDFPKGYTCANRPGVMVTEFVLSKQACLYSRRTYILFTVCLSILLVCFMVFAIVYRYRWHIRLSLYEWRSSRPVEQQEHGDVTHDVFIVYCVDDSDWVVDELVRRVEDDWRLRAFIHERDFIAGRWILDNTVMAMNSCRHILVVLSSRFTSSQWCNMELMLCQSHVIEHDLPSLLVVQLEEIETHRMSPVVAALRSITTFLEWPEDPRGERRFWEKLERCVRSMKTTSSITPRQDRQVR